MIPPHVCRSRGFSFSFSSRWHRSTRKDPCARGFSFSFSSRWRRSTRKDPYALRPVSQQSPQGCSRNSANVCLVEQIVLDLGGWNVGRFLSPLLFASDDQCCDAVVCPCSESSSSLFLSSLLFPSGDQCCGALACPCS